MANMLALVSLENKELVPILAAHVYTVCPTAIPLVSSARLEKTFVKCGESYCVANHDKACFVVTISLC